MNTLMDIWRTRFWTNAMVTQLIKDDAKMVSYFMRSGVVKLLYVRKKLTGKSLLALKNYICSWLIAASFYGTN